MLPFDRIPTRTSLPHTWLQVPSTDVTATDYTEYPTQARPAFSAVLTIDGLPAGLILNAADGTPTTLIPFAEQESRWDDFEAFVEQCRTDRGALVDVPSALEALIEQHLTEALITLATGSDLTALRLLELRPTPTGDAPLYGSREHQLVPKAPSGTHAALSRYMFTAFPPAADQWWQRWDSDTQAWADLTNTPYGYAPLTGSARRG